MGGGGKWTKKSLKFKSEWAGGGFKQLNKAKVSR
jgi:hypothetical protein